MKEIQLTQGKVALVDDEDFEWLNQWNWYCSCSDGYAIRVPRVKGRRTMILMHRAIMNTPAGMEVDHINHDKVDNRRENLRNCTKTENGRNRNIHKDNTTGFKGVSLDRRRFRAQIRFDNKNLNLGRFDTPEEAGRAYDKKAIELFGEFAKTNF